MAIRVLSGEGYNILATGDVTVSPTADALFPAANLPDGRPDSAFRFGSASTSECLITVDGNIVANGALDTFSGSAPTSWTADGTVALSTESATRINGGSLIRQDLTVRSGQRVVVAGEARNDGVAIGVFGAVLQNLDTGKFYNGTSWTASPAQLVSGATSSYTTNGPYPVVVEGFATVGQDRTRLRLTLRNFAVTSTDYVFVRGWYLWQSADFASIHGHNIRADLVAQLRSSPDNFATTSSGSSITQATLTKAQPSFYTVLSSAIDDRYWQLRLLYNVLSTTIGNPPTESVWLGEAVIGQATELTRPQDLGQELRMLADNIRVATPYGSAWSHRVGQSPRRVLGMSFNYFTSSEYQEARQEVFERSFGSANPIVVVPDDSQPEVLHGRINNEWAVRQTLGTHFTDNDLVVVEDAFPVWTE
jgi:hypothetical protein